MKFYSAKTSQAIDRDAIDNYGIPGILLMKRAGWFAFQTLQQQLLKSELPTQADNRKILVVCGTGNNGGDGFVVAQYALINGYPVTVCVIGDAQKISGDARLALEEMQQAGLQLHPFTNELIEQADIIVDALFGTGLSKPISGIYAEAIQQINASQKPVLAIDIPSGIHADSGAIQGVAIQAQHTCTFITQKPGLHTAKGQEHSGMVHFSSLFIDKQIYQQHAHFAENHPLKYWLNKLPPRKASHHKGTAGSTCLIGGNQSMMGAIQLAGLASLKSGSGLTKIITRKTHAVAITQAIPELMCYPRSRLESIIESCQSIGIGPGLGQDEWAEEVFSQSINAHSPKVIDADALRLLKNIDLSHNEANWILTPHPGEAAELLDCDNQTIQNDRIAAVQKLHARFGGVIILKGNGTLIYDEEKLEICLAGNAGMAVGGMGDVLTGTIASFLAQGLSLWDAANLGVSVHAHAGDIIARQHGEPGVMPSEVAQTIGQLLSYSGTSSN